MLDMDAARLPGRLVSLSMLLALCYRYRLHQPLDDDACFYIMKTGGVPTRITHARHDVFLICERCCLRAPGARLLGALLR